jgi:hypothetical protein
MKPPYRLKIGDKVRVEKAEGIPTVYGTGTVERLYRGTALVLYNTQYGQTYRRFHMETGRSIGGGSWGFMPSMRIIPITEQG